MEILHKCRQIALALLWITGITGYAAYSNQTIKRLNLPLHGTLDLKYLRDVILLLRHKRKFLHRLFHIRMHLIYSNIRISSTYS